LAEGAAEVREEIKKTDEQVAKSDKRFAEGNKRSREAIRGLRNEVTGLFLTFAGGSSLTGFIKDLIAGDAAVGRLANNLGVSTQDLSAWGLMAKQAGGDAGDAAAAFTALSRGFQMYRMTGNTGFNDDLRGLGVTLQDLATPADALLKMAEAGERMDRAEFFTRLSNIGIPASIITTLAAGRVETEKLVRVMREQSALAAQNAADAQNMEAALSSLETRIKAAVRPGIYSLVTGFVALLDKVDLSEAAVPVLTGLLGALAVATVAAFGPWIALAAAIGGVAYVVDQLIDMFPALKAGIEESGRALSDWLPEWLTVPVGDLLQGRTTWAEVDAAKRAGTSGVGGGQARQTFQSGGAGPAMVPKGQRAVALDGNNPGGINDGSFAKRQPGYVGANGRYAAFATMEDGLNAQRKLIRDNYVGKGYDTPAKIAPRYAPAGDGNDPRAYAATIARQMGIGVNDRIGPDQIEAFVQAQARTENRRFASRYAGAAAKPGATAAGRGFGNTVTIDKITVNTAATDAKGIAAELPGAIRSRLTTFNANTGLD
jgi:hypothetical protein